MVNFLSESMDQAYFVTQ